MTPKPRCDSLCMSSCNIYLCQPANSVQNMQHQQNQWATLRQLWLLLRSHKLLNMIASHSILTWQCKCAISICSTMVLNKSQSSLQSTTRIKLIKCDCESILIILMVLILQKQNNHLARLQNWLPMAQHGHLAQLCGKVFNCDHKKTWRSLPQLLQMHNKTFTFNQLQAIHQWPTYVGPNVQCSKES